MTTLLFCLLAPSQPDNDQNVELDKADRLERCISRLMPGMGSLPGAAAYHSSWNRRVQAV